MKTLYLHIGTPKTATTAIQLFCAHNQQVLNSYGYTYPDFGNRYAHVGRWRNAHFLVGEVRRRVKEREFEKEDQVIDECFSKIYELFQQYDNIILSDESLWLDEFRCKGRLWSRIKKEIEKDIFTVKIIVYLRRQDEFVYSRWNQQIKAAVGLISNNYVYKWEEMLEKFSYLKIDYYGMLENIANYVGKKNIIVRPFDRKKFYRGSIYADFLKVIGLEYSDQYMIAQETPNVSLTKNNVEIKRILNGLPNLNEYSNDVFRVCLTQCSELPSDDKKYSMFSKQEMKEFLSKCEEGNNKIAEEYLNGEKTLFDNAYKAEEKWTPDNPTMMEDIVRFSGSVAIYLLKENEELKYQLEELKSQIKKQNCEAELQKDDMNLLKYKLKHPFHTVGKKVKKAFIK